ncbi:MAG: hypothetical protein CYPHOPRED_001398 [Cyphobasidiales sp. Tagirdzhanova-0007]|nr:MAG: hypothetical protein CYPHOPRED_001398 [Cyphobasidiales sp. Tagirdzhanova-0007]
MSLLSAINNFISSILSIFTGIINSVLAVFQGFFSIFAGVINAATSLVQGVLGFMWNNIGVLLLLGFAILAYQIFIVDKGNLSRTRARAGNVANKKMS